MPWNISHENRALLSRSSRVFRAFRVTAAYFVQWRSHRQGPSVFKRHRRAYLLSVPIIVLSRLSGCILIIWETCFSGRYHQECVMYRETLSVCRFYLDNPQVPSIVYFGPPDSGARYHTLPAKPGKLMSSHGWLRSNFTFSARLPDAAAKSSRLISSFQ